MDRFGVMISTCCAAHCFLGALLATSAGAGRVMGDERLETCLAFAAALLALAALSVGWSKHRSPAPALCGAAGLFLLAATRTLELHEERIEVGLSVAGAALLVLAHVLNMRATRRCELGCVNEQVEA